MDELWERVRSGKHTAVLGFVPGDPPPAARVRVVRVRCDVPRGTFGPLDEARRKVQHILGARPPLLDQARDRVVSGLRRRLLGDFPGVVPEGALVEVYNRLAASSDPPAALVLEAVDAADDATLVTLRRILARPGWLKLPLVLAFRDASVDGAAAALLGTVQRVSGPDAVLRAPVPPGASPPLGASPKSTPEPIASPSTPAPDFRALPADVLRVLRAGALVGSGFEADLVAALLDVDVLHVLELLQRAADAGVPVDDRGEGRFHLPDALLDALRASTLPSLMVAHHRRLAELLGGLEQGPFSAEPAAAPMDLPAEAPPAAWPWAEVFGSQADAGHDGARAPERRPSPPPQAGEGEEPAPAVTVAGPASRQASPAQSEASAGPRPAEASRVDDARAAQHLAAAGELDASAERYLAAAQTAARSGAAPQALALADKVLAVLATLPESPPRRTLRARALIEIGRLRWAASSPHADFTLADALEPLDAARRALDSDAAPELRAEVGALIAAVCYDIGDAPALARALDELTSASRLLLDAGEATGAARLLNDQAAVYVRMGDPVRAAHLLSESRGIFEARAGSDPVAMIEMAETDHLLARIPLHVPARPGREGDAMTMGLDHALAAERTYRKLDAKRELGRVWETMGRLELRKGRLDRARERLVAAVRIEESIGDLVGLARATAALSELLAASGREEDAIRVLADSVALNFEKGSPIGLAYNRRALEALARGAGSQARLGGELATVQRTLSEAESVLGQIKLPGEPD